MNYSPNLQKLYFIHCVELLIHFYYSYKVWYLKHEHRPVMWWNSVSVLRSTEDLIIRKLWKGNLQLGKILLEPMFPSTSLRHLFEGYPNNCVSSDHMVHIPISMKSTVNLLNSGNTADCNNKTMQNGSFLETEYLNIIKAQFVLIVYDCGGINDEIWSWTIDQNLNHALKLIVSIKNVV